MTENIIVAVITGIFAFAGVALSNYTANRKNSIEQVKRDTKLEDKIQELREKIQKNNDDFALLAEAYDELTEKADSKMEIEDVDRTATSNNKNQQEGGVQ